MGSVDDFQREGQGSNPPSDDRLHPKLRSSAISSEVARARGYEALVDDAAGRARLTGLEFGDYVSLPGLLIPIWPPGSTAAEAYQFRPDTPRESRPKYETPAKSQIRVGVSPASMEAVSDAGVPLVIAESHLKADAAVSAGLHAVGLNGVWGWRRDGKPHKDLRKIEWGGRRAYIAFDSDAATNENVQQSESELAKYLTKLGAVVEVLRIPPGPDDVKQGLDDYLAAGHTGDDLLALKPTPEAESPAPLILPPSEPVQPKEVLRLWVEVRAAVERFVVFQRDEDLNAVALWVLHTWAIGAAETTLYLWISSPLPECGKSRLMEVLELLAANASYVVIPTAPSVFRQLDAAEGGLTLLLDELDKVYATSRDRSELTGVINQGYHRAGRVPRNVGTSLDMRVKMFPVFCPKALAGIEKDHDLLPDTVRTRSVPIRLHRRSDQQIDRFLRREVEQETAELRGRLQAWAEAAMPVLREVRTALPDDDTLTDRQLDCWEPLFAIADLGGPGFGQQMRDTAVVLHRKVDQEVPRDLLLIQHGYEAFSSPKADGGKLFTEDLIEALRTRRDANGDVDEDAPWAEMWRDVAWFDAGHRRAIGKRVAKMLKPYGIEPKLLFVNGRRGRGYRQEQFEEARRKWLK